MKTTILEFLGGLYQNIVFGYCITLFLIYILLIILSRLVINKNKFLSQYRNGQAVLHSAIAPGISVIAPAFNESVTIISSVRSLLTLSYPIYELIIVNDGSTDDTLDILIKEFGLEKVEYAYNPVLKTKPVIGIYKSKNKAYKKLIVVDKINGKCKADASNAGLNVAHYPYFLNTDADCVLDNQSLLKLIRPILEEKKPVIAVGAGLRIANSCDIDSGVINMVKTPKSILPRFQELEYIRSFMVGKLGWSYINSVPNVSGGLGLFDKEIAIKSGGYDSGSFAEDMDLIIRMEKNRLDENEEYAVRYLPDTLCWTEGPQSLETFTRQRVRWARGLWQIFSTHSKLLFNPKYKRLGMIVLPHNFIFELLAPIIELIGIIIYIYLIIQGLINWPTALILLAFVYFFMVFISIISVLWDQIVFKQYKSWMSVVSLSLMAFIEPLIYHPLIIYSAIKGYLFQIIGKKYVWGNMKRRGFRTTITTQTVITTTISNE